MLLKRPGLAILAAVTFALGIGLTTTMFSIIRGVALRGLPFDHPEQILYIGRVASGQPGVSTVPVDDFLEWRAGQHSFEQLAAFRSAQANMSDRTVPEVSRLAFITSNTLHLLRVAPVVGRDFNDADEQRGAPRVALISYRLWDARYRRDPSVISRTVRVNGVATEIVGVLPERFGFPDTPDLWMPLDLTPAAARGEGQRVDVFGRLKPAVSMAAAATEFRTMSMQSEALHPENRGVQAALMPYTHRFVDPQVVGTLFAMLAAVFGVMLIACVNVANLQLARAAERTRELAIRTALGAGRSRIVRQLLLEGLLLATAGAALGLIVATVGVALFDRAIVDNRPPFWFDIRIDTTVLAFVTLVTVVAALAGSLAPALRATRSDVNAVLKDEGRTNTGLRMGRFSRGLVIAEVLVSCCLLVVSGLMIKSVVTIAHIDYPYATDDVFVASVIASDAYATDGARRRLADRLDAELATIPGTRAIALASGTPEFTSG